MHKILIFLALAIGFMGSITFVALPKIESQANKAASTEETSSTGSSLPISTETAAQAEEKIDNKDIVRDKIEAIRKRLALKGLIIEGDSYYRDGQLPLALKKYLEFYKKNPYDTLIVEKLGDTYFEMKKFFSAYNYYSKIPVGNTSIKEKTVDSLVLTAKNDQESITKIRKQITELGLSKESGIYYDTSLTCLNDFHECKKKFGEYFWPAETQDILVSSGSLLGELEDKKLRRIKNSIVNYRNFQVNDVYLKDAYMIGAWYENGFYNLSAYLGEELLKEKSGYKPILKIVAQSYFELGKYEQSRSVLGKYYEIDDEEAGIAFLLGIVNTKLREYVLANIYLQKSIDLGYKDSSNARRQLIHNFYILENDKSMLNEFVSLIDSDEFQASDLSLAIYYHIIHGEYPQAIAWAREGKELFGSENGNFHTYEGWILTEQQQYESALEILKQGLAIDEKNPFILINLGYNAIVRGEKGEALIYFKKILSTAPNSEFTLHARQEIEKVSQK